MMKRYKEMSKGGGTKDTPSCIKESKIRPDITPNLYTYQVPLSLFLSLHLFSLVWEWDTPQARSVFKPSHALSLIPL